ncbi:MAG TPA: GGDEF domain-containing protein [Armatimonadota bacterium]|nr:GGDEF domain-containing protein [Armatimonadota bacterium]
MDAREQVTGYIHENVSEMLRTGEPRLDEERGHWHVPVLSDVGDRAAVLGTYVLDRRFRFIRNPVKQVMDRFTEQLSKANAGAAPAEDDDSTREASLGETVASPRPLMEHAQEIALVDQLTGQGTAAALLIRLEQEIDRATRYESTFCLAFLDVEGLWPINNDYGPLAADALIAQVGKLLERVVRGGDFVAHWAGARFAMLLEGPKDEVLIGVDRIISGVRAFAPVARAGEEPLSISANMGGVSVPRTDEDEPVTSASLIKEARGMLMAAKASDNSDPVFS